MGKAKHFALIQLFTIVIWINHVTVTSSQVKWCFHCTWSSGADIMNITDCTDSSQPAVHVIGKKFINPEQIFPKCKGSFPPGFYNKTGYDVLVQNCYVNACPLGSGGESCIKWSYFVKGELVNTTLFCAKSEERNVCYSQSLEGGFTREVCFCNGRSWCNSSLVLKMPLSFLVLAAVILSRMFLI